MHDKARTRLPSTVSSALQPTKLSKHMCLPAFRGHSHSEAQAVSSHMYANILFRVFCIYIHEQVAFNFPFLFVLDRAGDQGYTGLAE